MTDQKPDQDKVADADIVKTNLSSDHFVNMLIKEGAELLAQTERWNIITVEQFMPYIELFRPDKKRLKSDPTYRNEMTNLFQRYRVNLSINIHQPTLVVDRLEEPRREMAFLDRIFSRINPDAIDGPSARLNVPSAVSKTADLNREDLLVNASILDLMAANSSDSSKSHFQILRAESALFKKYFAENNLKQELRQEYLGSGKEDSSSTEEKPIADLSSSSHFGLDDDD